jgi:excisionase family DNA binding protein
MNRYDAPTLPRELEALVPMLAKLYARILGEHGHHRSAVGALGPPVKTAPERPMLLRISEVAEALSISRSSAYVLIRTGEIPVVRIGRSVRVSTYDLQSWIRANSSSL